MNMAKKIQEKAKENNMEPKAYVDKIVKDIKELWKMLEVEYDELLEPQTRNMKGSTIHISTIIQSRGGYL